jgi:hypothetical protein
VAHAEFWNDWNPRTFTFPEDEKICSYHKGNDWMVKESEARFLAYLATKAPAEGHIVEIGSWSAKSTSFLGQVAKSVRQQPMYAIDLWDLAPWHSEGTWEFFRHTIRNLDLEETVVPIKADSREAGANWSSPISLLFIDGDHSYQGALSDYKFFAPHVVKGGIIAFHDFSDIAYADVERVIKEVVIPSGEWTDYYVFSDPAGIWCARRR